MAQQCVYRPPPQYPSGTVAAPTKGVVVLEAIIGKDGTVKDLGILLGHPILARSAIETVKTWRYTPVVYNGQPVDVATEIVIAFKAPATRR
jgi:TonB family protein